MNLCLLWRIEWLEIGNNVGTVDRFVYMLKVGEPFWVFFTLILIFFSISNGHLYLSVVWLVMNVRMDTKMTSVGKKIGLCAHNLLTILNTRLIIFRPSWSFISSQFIGYLYVIQKPWGKWPRNGENRLLVTHEPWLSLKI